MTICLHNSILAGIRNEDYTAGVNSNALWVTQAEDVEGAGKAIAPERTDDVSVEINLPDSAIPGICDVQLGPKHCYTSRIIQLCRSSGPTIAAEARSSISCNGIDNTVGYNANPVVVGIGNVKGTTRISGCSNSMWTVD